MKTKIIATILVACMVIGSLTGCGSTAETETEVASQTQEETVANPVEETVEETEVIEEESLEVTEESAEAEENEEVVEEPEEVNLEREDFTISYVVTNFAEDSGYKYYLDTVDKYSSNDYLATDIMLELASRGYDIDNFVVTYGVAMNNEGVWEIEDKTVNFYPFEGITDEYVKLFPMFIKYGEVDESKYVYNATLIDPETKEQLPVNYADDKAVEAWYKIFDSVNNMKNDENYEEIDFNIPDTIFSENVITNLIPNIADDEKIPIKEFTINDWFNGMIYGIFVEESIDLDGFFDAQGIMY